MEMDLTESSQTPAETGLPVVVVNWAPSPPPPGERWASHEGTGDLEILEIIETLENAGIDCCAVGTSALRYYGASRIRGDWHICVPTDKFRAASSLLQSPPHAQKYALVEPYRPIPLRSILHTFPRYKYRSVQLWFQIVPAEDCHLDCSPPTLERSRRKIAYPKLEIFAQSLLDMDNRVDLADLIDGMDLSLEWGEQRLNLDSTNDVKWAERKNETIRASVPRTEDSCLLELPAVPVNRREIWVSIVMKKESRIKPGLPRELYATRFRARSSQDPRLHDMI